MSQSSGMSLALQSRLPVWQLPQPYDSTASTQLWSQSTEQQCGDILLQMHVSMAGSLQPGP